MLVPALAVPAAAHAQRPARHAAPVTAPSLDGAWAGALDVGGTKLRLVFHLATTPAGLTATFDSPDQGANGLPTSSVTRSGDTLRIEAAQIHGVFEGTIAKDHSTITGTWTQGGNSLPLVLTPLKQGAVAEPKRPQNPVKPYPYQSIDVTYTNPTQHDVLAATLTLPAGKGPFPAALLITGSGPQDRDETLMGHKPFLVLSDYLTRHGIAVLRADDRGVGQSTGDFATATTADFATDAEAGVAFLKSRPEIDPHRIGLIGHSEGGVIAPMVAARNHDIAFIVLLAGTGVPGSEVLAEQQLRINVARGVPIAQAEDANAKERELLALVVNEKDPATRDAKLRKLMSQEMPLARVDGALRQLTAPWSLYFIRYDPAPALRQVTCPVLALDGSKDLQISATQNLVAIRRALTEGGNTHIVVKEMPGLNHLFQTATTGLPTEYPEIEETMAPVVLETITQWILANSGS